MIDGNMNWLFPWCLLEWMTGDFTSFVASVCWLSPISLDWLRTLGALLINYMEGDLSIDPWFFSKFLDSVRSPPVSFSIEFSLILWVTSKLCFLYLMFFTFLYSLLMIMLGCEVSAFKSSTMLLEGSLCKEWLPSDTNSLLASVCYLTFNSSCFGDFTYCNRLAASNELRLLELNGLTKDPFFEMFSNYKILTIASNRFLWFLIELFFLLLPLTLMEPSALRVPYIFD